MVATVSPHDTSQREALAGLVERLTFHNEDNGFCVLRVKARGHRDLVTVVGHAAMINPGEFIQASGAWVNDRQHGPQFKAQFLKAAPPTTAEGIKKYFGSGMIKGIGPVHIGACGVNFWQGMGMGFSIARTDANAFQVSCLSSPQDPEGSLCGEELAGLRGSASAAWRYSDLDRW